MTEYIIIVALIAIAAISAVSFFGSAVQAQFTDMAKVLTGGQASEAQTVTNAGKVAEQKTLQNFSDDANGGGG